MEDSTETYQRRPAVLRIALAVAAALSFALGVYFLLEALRPESGLISFSFLLVLPAAVCAFVCYVADPYAERTHGFYLKVPQWLLLVVIIASLFVLREGVICIIMLSPLWILSGLIGAHVTYKLRRRNPDQDGRAYCAALVLLPLLSMQIEPMIPLPVETKTVTRSIVVEASPAQIWPLLRGIPDVRPGEGAWNVSQDVIGIPRPIGARLVGTGIGADRHADWGQRIKFRERITEWQPGRRLGWRFIFDDIAGWGYTDRHLMPDSPYFTVTTGGYTMQPLGANRTRVTLDTSYRIQTPVNLYSELWGQLFLGDLENNLLSLVKQRAERGVGENVRKALTQPHDT
ncbi:SRPBCC family protein [Sphingomonas hylomeconis]|uniref:SRPBCC family protein n=1 Tax=Sphingomonas hylomeconis TaxID=1395958 RepID=A0ABV7STA2_9SPHN|nr:SRPBCC family protein [Sphingomonas hylomeconis]